MQSAEGADLSLDSPGLAQELLRDVAGGKDVVLLVSSSCGKEVMDHVALALEGRQDRVVRVSGAGERGAAEPDIAALTTTGPSCDRIIVLVDHADALERSALKAVERACRTRGLCLVFAGLPRMLMLLDDGDVPMLRGRLLRGVRYSAIDDTGVLPPVAATLETVVPRSRRLPIAAIGAACAAVLGLFGIITVRAFVPRETERPASRATASVVAPVPAPVADAVAETTRDIEAEAAPAAPEVVRAPVAEPGPAPRVRPTKQHAERPGRAVRTVAHAAPASRRPEKGRKESQLGDYIGSFSPGADGVRSFRYRP